MLRTRLFSSAGHGKRFLSAAKPMEVLTIVSKPFIGRYIEGVVEIGMAQVGLVSWRGKRAAKGRLTADPMAAK